MPLKQMLQCFPKWQFFFLELAQFELYYQHQQEQFLVHMIFFFGHGRVADCRAHNSLFYTKLLIIIIIEDAVITILFSSLFVDIGKEGFFNWPTSACHAMPKNWSSIQNIDKNGRLQHTGQNSVQKAKRTTEIWYYLLNMIQEYWNYILFLDKPKQMSEKLKIISSNICRDDFSQEIIVLLCRIWDFILSSVNARMGHTTSTTMYYYF